ncbi:MAG: hypothetical protein PUD59_03840 [bacterium]|nr:hypothetical protein [bacterium]
MNKNDYSGEIIKSEEFNILRHLQHCSSSVVHENDQIFLNGTFYNYSDNSDELKEYKEKLINEFVQSIIGVISKRYPSLSDEQIRQIAVKCSGHSKENIDDSILDIDICAMQYFEENKLNNELHQCIENIKDSVTKIKRDTFDIETYSEEYAKSFVLSQLNKHIQNANEPLLTWGEARLVAEMNTEFVKQSKVSITF